MNRMKTASPLVGPSFLYTGREKKSLYCKLAYCKIVTVDGGDGRPCTTVRYLTGIVSSEKRVQYTVVSYNSRKGKYDSELLRVSRPIVRPGVLLICWHDLLAFRGPYPRLARMPNAKQSASARTMACRRNGATRRLRPQVANGSS
jgi:hypothetical protein